MRTLAVLILALSVCRADQIPIDSAKEEALGALMAQEIRRTTSLVSDPAARAYVSQLASKLIGSNLVLTLEITDDDRGLTHEPIWLPGGYVFVSVALIRAARDESEFAGMLAHALVHERYHDNRRIMASASDGTTLLIWTGGWFGTESGFMPAGVRARYRALELETDAAVIKLIANAGYDPGALERYFTRLQSSDTERIEGIRRAIDELPPQSSPIVDSSSFQEVREKLDSGSYRFPPTLRRPYEQ